MYGAADFFSFASRSISATALSSPSCCLKNWKRRAHASIAPTLIAIAFSMNSRSFWSSFLSE
jgi:hypothetical protein